MPIGAASRRRLEFSADKFQHRGVGRQTMAAPRPEVDDRRDGGYASEPENVSSSPKKRQRRRRRRPAAKTTPASSSSSSSLDAAPFQATPQIRRPIDLSPTTPSFLAAPFDRGPSVTSAYDSGASRDSAGSRNSAGSRSEARDAGDEADDEDAEKTRLRMEEEEEEEEEEEDDNILQLTSSPMRDFYQIVAFESNSPRVDFDDSADANLADANLADAAGDAENDPAYDSMVLGKNDDDKEDDDEDDDDFDCNDVERAAQVSAEAKRKIKLREKRIRNQTIVISAPIGIGAVGSGVGSGPSAFDRSRLSSSKIEEEGDSFSLLIDEETIPTSSSSKSEEVDGSLDWSEVKSRFSKANGFSSSSSLIDEEIGRAWSHPELDRHEELGSPLRRPASFSSSSSSSYLPFLHKDDDYEDQLLRRESTPKDEDARRLRLLSQRLFDGAFREEDRPDVSPSKRRRRRHRRRRRRSRDAADSDSDVEDLKHVLGESTGQLKVTNSILREEGEAERRSPEKSLPKCTHQLLATCHANITCLKTVRDHLDSAIRAGQTTIPRQSLEELDDVIDLWDVVKDVTVKRHNRDLVAERRTENCVTVNELNDRNPAKKDERDDVGVICYIDEERIDDEASKWQRQIGDVESASSFSSSSWSSSSLSSSSSSSSSAPLRKRRRRRRRRSFSAAAAAAAEAFVLRLVKFFFLLLRLTSDRIFNNNNDDDGNKRFLSTPPEPTKRTWRRNLTAAAIVAAFLLTNAVVVLVKVLVESPFYCCSEFRTLSIDIRPRLRYFNGPPPT